jgi:integrase
MDAITLKPYESVFEQHARTLISTRRSPHTRTAYSHDLATWLDWCRQRGLEPETPVLDDAVAFRDHLGALLAPASARRCLAALSSIYRKLLLARVARANPFHPTFLPWPPAGSIGTTVAVTDKTAQAMLAAAAAAQGLRDVAVLRLLYDTGLRRESVARLLRADLRQEGSQLILRTLVKGEKRVELAVPPETGAAVAAWLAHAPPSLYVFAGQHGQPWNVTRVNQIVARWATAAGGEHVHPHCFRAAFITTAYDTGLPEHEIQAAAHHADPKTTRRYDRGQRGGAVMEAVAKRRRGEGT